MTKNEINIKDALINKFNVPVSIYDGKHTKTTQFMLQSVNVDITNRTVFKFFINAFLNDSGIEHNYDRAIFILLGCKDYRDKDWNKVFTSLALSKNYVGDYDCGIENGYNLVMVVFRVPEEFADDYYHFIRGRYSRFSPKYKEKFPRYIKDANNREKESILWQIINKAPSLKRDLEREFNLNEGELDLPTVIDGKVYPKAEEVWDYPRKEREYYRYEKRISIFGQKQLNTSSNRIPAGDS